MAEKKKGTGRVPHTNKDNISQSQGKAQKTGTAGTVDESIVAKMLEFNAENYLDETQITSYGVLLDAISEIEEERKAECAKKGLSPDTWEFAEHWNSIRNLEYSDYNGRLTMYEAAAIVEFAEQYKEYIPELEEAYRRKCWEVVDRMRGQVKERLAGYGMTLKEGRNIEADIKRRGIKHYNPFMCWIMAQDGPKPQDGPKLNVPYAKNKAELDVLTLFSDSALDAAIQAQANHIFFALDAAYMKANLGAPAGDDLIKFKQTVWAEILPHKWDDSKTKKRGKQPDQLKQYSAGSEWLLPASAVSRELFLGSREWIHTGHACVREGKGLYAGIDVRVDAPEDTAEYIAGELLLPCSDILDMHCLDGFDYTVIISVASIIKHSAEHGVPFDPKRKMFYSTIHKQISQGRRFTTSRALEIAASIKRLSTFRQRVRSPLYRRKNGTDIMDGYTTEWVHYLECVPGVDCTGSGNRPYVRILEMPLIVVQAEGVNQCQSVPCSIFNRDTNESREVIAIRTTLLTKIVDMKRANLKHIDITYDLLYWAAGETFSGMNVQQREKRSSSIVGMAKRQLDAWAMPPYGHTPTIRKVTEKRTAHGYTTQRKGNVFALRVYDTE